MTIAVKTYYVTDAEGSPVPEDVSMEDLPITYHGPFASLEAAIHWMETVWPDGDTDVYDQIADDFDVSPEDLNDPNGLFADFTEERIKELLDQRTPEQ